MALLTQAGEKSKHAACDGVTCMLSDLAGQGMVAIHNVFGLSVANLGG